MITIRQSVVALIVAGSLYLVGTNVRFSLNGTTAGNPLYAQAPDATSAEEQELIEGAEKLSKAFRVAAGKVRPAVVRINSLVRQNSRRRSAEEIPGIPEEFRGFFGEDLFREFENRNQRRGQNTPRSDEEQGELQTAGVGSGVIVSTDGYILTNNHVVDGAEQLEVELSDGRTLSGKVIGTDDKSDVAVIKIDASGLIAARLGDSNQMDVGDWVIAVGSPFELDQTVTAGIISATNRSVEILDYEDFLQTDAAINPGNSGGPLVNLRGEVIGINTAINSRSGSNAGVGFAIPSSMARLIMDNLIENGRVVRGFIGATLETVSPEIVKEYKLGEPSLR
ncbi:MAG: trypsin-like peptidase domain-containing protein, partial [Pirellulales bacterium]